MAAVKVTATRLNIRTAPSPTAVIVGTLSQHDRVDITEVQGEWGLMFRGWINLKHTIADAVTLSLADAALSIARSQLGVAEQPPGSNSGPKVSQYLASVGITFPAPWCMAFVYWCVDNAARELKQPNPLKKTGGVMDQWNSRRALRMKVPQKGDLFVMSFGKGLGHIGFVDRVEGQRIFTIEGNSNDEGSREGYEVCRKPGGRAVSSCIGFLRLNP